MKSYKLSLLGILTFFGCITTNAQDTGENTLGAWYIYFGTNTISNTLSIHTELQYNVYEITSNLEQFWAITALNYSVAPDAQVSLGYGYFNGDPTFEDTPLEENTWENRVFEQFTHSARIGKFALQNRYRIEHRFIELPAQSITRQRVRGRLQVNYPLTEKWFLIAFDEIFLDLREPVFNQNRLFGALGRKITPNAAVQVGYMKLHLPGRAYDRLQLVLNINTDLRKKKDVIN
ncbi:DUF2490 domain-containing protein [Altibacter sp.]|uniref:DUF2490 domain-containing protein n=1 Tax=Altibacter sp. TaxID=2024823 RepID=UPI000C8A1D2B|nr:DUF2490 domain-containing protein [Altibacter sp.]MAP55002.1 hypothetical protein [Altibacter sp.]